MALAFQLSENMSPRELAVHLYSGPIIPSAGNAQPCGGKISCPARRASAACRLGSEKILVPQKAPPHPGPLPQRRGRSA